MRLSDKERETLGAQVAGLDAGQSRTTPGTPGSRTQPLSCQLLVEQRRAILERGRA